ncbi:MAG TPA: heme biosynthesis HemY N-terminal domain-containing protein [Xanthobacteraceae bacterium]
MIRVVLFLVIVGALSLGVAWLADRPGDVLISWQGLHIETSLMVLGAATVAAMALLALVFGILRAILRSPTVLADRLRHRRGVRAYEAISDGLIAIGAGDVAAARKLSTEVNRIAAAEPLALLLSAQSAQLAGDREGAERVFRTMAGRADTKALGLHGLFIEAQRRDDLAGARAYAEEAVRTAPALAWAGRAVLEFRCATGDWTGALAMLERTKGALADDIYRRQRAVMLTARALVAEESDRDGAKASALEAVRLVPTLAPAAALAGRLLAEGGELRKAARIIEKAWCANPNPDLAQTYAELRFGDAARDRLTRMERLASKAPGSLEGALAIARAALDAREFAKTRAALAPYIGAPTRRVALLMAELERAEHNDEGRAREWIARALHAAPDPAWTADGHVSDRWLPVSPLTGRLDAFEWRVPLTGISAAPTIEPAAADVAPIELKATPLEGKAAAPPAPTQQATSAPTARHGGVAAAKPRPIIPLVHAPDDPGPDAGDETSPPPEPQIGSWRKLFE